VLPVGSFEQYSGYLPVIIDIAGNLVWWDRQ
jgi:hypothetical protein